MDNIVTLAVNGQEYGGWKTVEIQKSLKSACNGFSLDVSEKWPNGGWRIPGGSACEIFIDGDLDITGYVDKHSFSIDDNDHTVTINGRSKTSDIVDCGCIHEPGNWVEQTAGAIAEELCGPFGIVVDIQAEGAPIPKYDINQGETVFETIERAAKSQQFLIVTNPFGDLVLTDSNNAEHYNFVLPDYLIASANFDYSKRYSHYLVKAQQHGPDFDDPAEACEVVGECEDTKLPRYRSKVIRPEGSINQDEATKRAEWERNRDIGESISVKIELQGFYTPDNKLWDINRIIRVTDDVLGLDHDLLIYALTRRQTKTEGTKTILELAPPEAFKPAPITKKVAETVGGYHDL